MTSGLIAHLHKQDRSLLRRHGVRLRVEEITADGRNAICSAYQAERRFFR